MRCPWLALTATLLLAGCTVDGIGSEDPGDGSGGDGVGSAGAAEGKLTLNGLALDLSVLIGLEPSALGHWESETVAIADSGSIDSLLAHPNGPEHLEYLALCALDEGTELVAGGARYPGLFGLGTEWVDAGCGDGCQRWISGCVLAHANAYGVSVEMSLRGAHPGMTWDDRIAEEFVLQEAAFYGNVFEVTGLDYPGQPLYACIGRALIAWEDDPAREDTSLDYLQKRICGTGDCGLNSTGPCTAPVAEGSICSHDAGWEGYYADCEGESYVDPLHVPVYTEVVTSYLVEE
ncbi:MAG TPA: hypothetical protein VFU21_13790 [Kofleriaceae bacterium]|nr:hypothetical protein [Kofleriaceae bacterium]